MTNLLLAVLVVILCDVTDAARVVDANIRAQIGARHVVRRNRSPTFHRMLGLSNDIRIKPDSEMFTTVHGTVRRKFREVYRGLYIVGGSIEADVDTQGVYRGGVIGGKLVLGIRDDVPNIYCMFNRTKTIETVLTKEGLNAADIVDLKITPRVIMTDKHRKAHLAVIVDMFLKTENGFSAPFYYIDMCNGNVVKSFNKISSATASWNTDVTGSGDTDVTGSGDTGAWETGSTWAWETGSTLVWETGSTGAGETDTAVTRSKTTAGPTQTSAPVSCATVVGVGGNKKTGEYSYGSTQRCLKPKVVDTQCFMENEHVTVIDLKTSTDLSKRAPIEFKCSEGYNDGVNEAYGPANDAFFYGTISQRMLKEWYGGAPIKPLIYVHYDTDLDNAYWQNGAMMIGDGQTTFYPLCNLDTIAHELGHGFTEKFSDLEYSGQSGGMNEAFSDMIGEAAEHFYGKNDWLSGFQDTKDPNEPLRYFKTPSDDGQSIDDVSGYTEDMSVHLSSGVYNRAFYQIIKVQGVPMRYGFEAFLKANRMYWKENTNFVDGACGVMRAAYDLGLDTEKFKAGFSVVGITGCDINNYLEKVTAAKPRSKISVSSIHQPVFGINLKASDTSITLTTSGGNGVKLAISKSLSRDSPEVIGSSGSVTWTTGGQVGIVYIRLLTDTEEKVTDVGLSLSVQ